MTIRMRRRLAVGAVLYNRTLFLFRIGLSPCPVSPVKGPRRTRPCAHTLTFLVTTAYITHTCSTVQPLHTHVSHTQPLFSYLQRLRSLSIYRPAALSFITLSLHIPCLTRLSSATFLNVLFWLLDSYPDLICFCYYFCYLYNGRAVFFLISSLLVWIAAETIGGERRSSETVYIQHFPPLDMCTVWQRSFTSKLFPLLLGVPSPLISL